MMGQQPQQQRARGEGRVNQQRQATIGLGLVILTDGVDRPTTQPIPDPATLTPLTPEVISKQVSAYCSGPHMYRSTTPDSDCTRFWS